MITKFEGKSMKKSKTRLSAAFIVPVILLVCLTGVLVSEIHAFTPRRPGPADWHLYVTPLDPSVVRAAEGKNWTEMVNCVASNISYIYSAEFWGHYWWQYPNETLALGHGECHDYAALLVSMLLARGYTAYVAIGTLNLPDCQGRHAWAIINFTGTFMNIEPQASATSQQTINFTGYSADYYFDERGVYYAGSLKALPWLLLINPISLTLGVLALPPLVIGTAAVIYAYASRLRRNKHVVAADAPLTGKKERQSGEG